MPPPRKKAKLETMRCPNNPVSFEQFKKLIQNLPDISFEVQRDGVAGKGATLDECAFWYYESFYKNPEVRHKYPHKLRACPMRIRDKLLSMPQSEPVGETAAADEHQIGKGVIVRVARMGTFRFPVTFFAFKTYVNVEKVLRMMSKTSEERKALLAFGNQCEIILKKFYNSFYMFPDRQSTDIFKDVSKPFLEVLLRHGEPYDDLAKKSVEKHAAEKRKTVIVSFEQFEKYLSNMFDIVCQLKLHDSDYAALDFEKCARAFYLNFYLKPEIRDRYTFKWRSCSPAMQKRLLNIPNAESAEELRKSFPYLIPNSQNEEEEEEIIEVDIESPVIEVIEEEPISAGDALRRSLEINNNSCEKQLIQPAQEKKAPPKGDPLKEHVASSEELPRLVLAESSEEEELFQTDVEVDIKASGRFMFPVSFDTFRRCINYAEILRPLLTLALKDKSQLEDLIPHPHNPICEKIFLRFYRSFYIFPDTRQKCEYRFSCRNDHVFKKLSEYAKPLNESAMKTMNEPKPKCQEATNVVPAEQSKKNPAEESDIATVLDHQKRDNKEKLSEYAKPLNESAIKTMNEPKTNCQEAKSEVPVEQSKKNPAEESDIATVLGHQKIDNKENTKDKEIKENIEEKAKKLPNFPVTFHVFKRYVTNLNEILQQMKLCDEYKDKSDSECADEYYKGFYTSPEMRNKFECVMRPCPGKMRDVLHSYAQQPAVSVDSVDVLPTATEKSNGIPVKESKVIKETHEKQKVDSSLESDDCVCLSDVANLSAKSKGIPPVKECKVIMETHENHVSFKLFKHYIRNLKEIVEQMLLCDEYAGKSEEECARDYYNGFYSSQNVRDRFPYQLKPCPAKMRQKLLSFPTKDQHKDDVLPEKPTDCVSIPKKLTENILIETEEEVKVNSSEIPVPTEECRLPQDQTSNNCEQTAAKSGNKSPKVSKQKTLRTFKNGASFEFPVSFETFKRHINYDEIVKSLLEDGQNEIERSDEVKVKELFRKFFCSFYVQKDVRQSHSYRFQNADKELLEKLEAYAVPLNDVAKKTMSDQTHGGTASQNERNEDVAPRAAMDETLATISGIEYRFPVSFETFHKYINYEELKEGLANGGNVKKKSAEELAAILGDETSCLRLLRRYYYSFYIRKNIRNKLKYNFNAAPPELSDKLLEWAEPIAKKSTEPAKSLSPKAQTKQGCPNAKEAPVTLNVFLNYMLLDDVVAGMQQEPEYSTMTEDECKLQYYQAFYSDLSIRDKYPFKLKPCSVEMRERLLLMLPSPPSDLDALNATRERELSGPPRFSRSLSHISVPENRALLERYILDSTTTTKENKIVLRKEETTAREKESTTREEKTTTREETAARGKEEPATRKGDNSTREKDNGMIGETTREEAAAREPTKREPTTREPTTSEGKTTTTSKEATKRRREETTTRREATTTSKEATTTRRDETTTEKDIEAKTTNKSPAVPEKVIENNLPKENATQKSSKLPATVSEKISKTSKKNYGENARTERADEASRSVSHSDSTKTPQSSSDLPSPASTINKEVTKKPEETQNKGNPTESQDGTGTRETTAAASNASSHQQTERQIILDQAKKVFFAERSQDHNMAYLICTSQGLKRAIWRILYQLTLEEFKAYTSIHDGEDLYKNDANLQPYYQHIVDKGNWPINLYVRLPLLRQLLHSKGVELGSRLDLRELSPKILHWREADEHTNFDQIVERQFKDRTGEEIDSVEEWFEERERFYAACWLRDQWIYEVPQITNDSLHDESYIKDLPLPQLKGVVLKSLPMARSEDLSSQTEIISIASSSDVVPDSQRSCPFTQLSSTSANFLDITTMDMQSRSARHDESLINAILFSSESDMVPDSQSCPPTQLSHHTSNFVDIASVDMQSQVPETPLDPLAAATQAKTLSCVKQEPIKFLNNLRGVCDTNGCQWENIGTEELIVNLDSSQEEAPSLSCFAIQQPSETISRYQSLDSLLTSTMFEENSVGVAVAAESKESDKSGGLADHEEAGPKIADVNVNQLPEEPASRLKVPEVPEQPEEPAVVPAPSRKACQVNIIRVRTLPKLPQETRKKKLPASNAMPSKRARLANDKVPQLRHEFRPLPLGACVRIETDVLWTDETSTEPSTEIIPTPLGTDKTSTEAPQIIPTPLETDKTSTEPPPPPPPQSAEVASSNLTPSQDFALGNTLLESSQLAALLDALPPSLTVKKVNEKEQQVSGKSAKVTTLPKPSIWEIGIFRKLERFQFFNPLTLQHITKYMIEGYMPGPTYQSAFLKIDGKKSQVQGPLLNALFPHLSPRLRFDLERVLFELPEFIYSCWWWRMPTDSTEDLRKRVLFTFMDLAPGFGQFRLSRDWGTYREIGQWDPAERRAPKPSSLETVINPGILDKMREFKEMC